MRKDNLILITAVVAVVALIVAIPALMTGCGGEDTTVDCYRLAQQVQDRDRDFAEGSDCPGMQGRWMSRQGMGQGTYCDGGCVETDCDGYHEDASGGDCYDDCWGVGATDEEPFGSEPICF